MVSPAAWSSAFRTPSELARFMLHPGGGDTCKDKSVREGGGDTAQVAMHVQGSHDSQRKFARTYCPNSEARRSAAINYSNWISSSKMRRGPWGTQGLTLQWHWCPRLYVQEHASIHTPSPACIDWLTRGHGCLLHKASVLKCKKRSLE